MNSCCRGEHTLRVNVQQSKQVEFLFLILISNHSAISCTGGSEYSVRNVSEDIRYVDTGCSITPNIFFAGTHRHINGLVQERRYSRVR